MILCMPPRVKSKIFVYNYRLLQSGYDFILNFSLHETDNQ